MMYALAIISAILIVVIVIMYEKNIKLKDDVRILEFHNSILQNALDQIGTLEERYHS